MSYIELKKIFGKTWFIVGLLVLVSSCIHDEDDEEPDSKVSWCIKEDRSRECFIYHEDEVPECSSYKIDVYTSFEECESAITGALIGGDHGNPLQDQGASDDNGPVTSGGISAGYGLTDSNMSLNTDFSSECSLTTIWNGESGDASSVCESVCEAGGSSTIEGDSLCSELEEDYGVSAYDNCMIC